MNIINELIEEDKFDYKCFDELKRLLNENEYFKNIVIEGYQNGKIFGFPNELWDKIRSQNIRRINSFEDVFKDGANIGYCTVASKQLSYSFSSCFICGGILPLLKGTKNCLDGSHTWIQYEDYIIDTTLMLIMHINYAKKIGYIEENKYNPNNDPIYLSTKEFTNDESLKKTK